MDWSPTHAVPAGGMAAWDSPDPSRPPVTSLAERLDLVVEARSGDWAKVRAVNGWSGWVDGRRLIAMQAHAAPLPPSPAPQYQQPAEAAAQPGSPQPVSQPGAWASPVQLPAVPAQGLAPQRSRTPIIVGAIGLVVVLVGALAIGAYVIGTSKSSSSGGGASTPGKMLYLCESGESKVLTDTVCMGDETHTVSTQLILYPSLGHSPIAFTYTLAGDIKGTTYRFDLYLGTSGTMTVGAQIVLSQGGQETVLASTTLTATGTEFKAYSQEVTGPDPATAQGDTLILRITPESGSNGAVMYSNSASHTSTIQIPTVG